MILTSLIDSRRQHLFLFIFAETCSHLGIPIPPDDAMQLYEKERESKSTQPKKNPVGRPSTRGNQPTDEHNEVCEVCERGGDLLCCETCTLVFHMKCLRPKLTTLPKKKWSCPHCILDVSFFFFFFRPLFCS